MGKKQNYATKKNILKSIQALAGLDPEDFKKGVVDLLELLYEQDVSMTNIMAEKVDQLEARLDMLKGVVLGLHIASLRHIKGEGITGDDLMGLAAMYEIDLYKIKEFTDEQSQAEVFKNIKKYFNLPKN